VYGSLKLRKIH